MPFQDISGFRRFPIGDELVVARPDIEGLFLLNVTARFIFEEFSKGSPPEAIADGLVSRFGAPSTQALADVNRTLEGWSHGLLSSVRPGLPEDGDPAAVWRDFGKRSGTVRIDCRLNGKDFRVLLDEGELVDEIYPRLDRVAVPDLPPGSPFATLALVDRGDRIFLFRDGVCIAQDEKVTGARALLLQEMASLCGEGRTPRAILHAGACGTESGSVILAGASHAGKSTLCAALMSDGFLCYSDDSAVLDREFRVCGMPFPIMLRESSWAALEPRFRAFMESAPIYQRPDHRVRFLPSNLPRFSSPAAPAKALVFVDYRPGADVRLEPLTTFEALLGLQRGGIWVEHNEDSITGFLAWLDGIARCRLTYSAIAEASAAIETFLE